MKSNNIEKLIKLVNSCFDLKEYLSRFMGLTEEEFYFCPICNEKFRSLVINTKDKYFACCNCENSGDFIALLELIKGVSTIEILVEIIRYGNLIPIKSESIFGKKKRLKKQVLPEAVL